MKCHWLIAQKNYNLDGQSIVLSVAGTDNVNGNNDDNNIIFTIKDTELYVPVVTLSARENQKSSKLLSKGSERSVYWNGYKTKSDNKNTTNEFRFFLQSNFVVVNRSFVLVYTKMLLLKDLKLQGITYLEELLLIIMSSSMEKNFYDQAIDLHIKR